ncbi:MAG TPA: lysylphosphatidylglycerol synthase transmembrane domain-containing protein [Thermodesulfovibrionales bacterium]|nr:lysylphosphatidylglycerol synthase transmembrane domain-containing protein [Thermodesulfovibrionales bacterium]
MSHSKTFKIILGFAVSGLFLFFAFYKIEFSQFLAAFLNINGVDIALCVLFFGLSCVFRAIMWRITTHQILTVKYTTLFGGIVVGYMANYVLPLRIGEMVRVYYLNKCAGISRMAGLSTVFIERLFDVSSLAVFLLIGIWYGSRGLTPDTVKILFIMIAIIALTAVTLYMISKATNLLPRHGRLLSRSLTYIERFLQPLGQLKQSNTLFLVFLLSISAWTCNYLSILSLTHRMPSLFFEAALVLLLFVNIGFLIPSSPGALGVMQVAFWMALAPFHVVKENALALSFAYQGGIFLFSLLIGLPYFLRANLRLGQVLKTS